MIWICEMYICSYTQESETHSKHWWFSWFWYETFITFFKFRFSTRGERDTIFLCWLFVHHQVSTHWPNQHARAPRSPHLTGFAQVWKINLLRLSPNLNSLFLFKITKNPSPSLPGMMSVTSPVTFPIWGFYCDICHCHILPAHAWTPALMSAPTQALSRKVIC